MALFERKMHDPVPGTARVVDNDGLHSIPGQSIHCPLDLVVEADGIPAYMVHIKVRPPTGKWPALNQILPVVLDRAEPTRVDIVWDQVSSLQERVDADRARRIEAAQRSVAGGSDSVGPIGDGSPQDFMRQALADPAAFVERMRAQGTHPIPVPSGPQVAVTQPDPVSQIAKLAELHDRGALTDDEFAAMKARILGG